MSEPIAVSTLLLLCLSLAPAASAESPERCAELGPDGYPAYCEGVGERVAPRYGGEACCDGELCVEPEREGCPEGMAPFSCAFGELDSLGLLHCMFTVPHYCDDHPCPDTSDDGGTYQAPPQALLICCYQEGCYDPGDGFCGGILYYCDDGSSNADGTIDCDDGDIPW
jgi:hypothetical protein